MSGYYILDEKHNAVKCTMDEWSAYFENNDARRVAFTEDGEISVSTVFLVIDHNWGEGEPLLFETTIFGGEHDQDQWRYHTWDEAEKGHAEACKIAGVKP